MALYLRQNPFMMKNKIILLSTVFSCLSAGAAEYYVANNGSNTAGNLNSHSVATPVATLSYVIRNARLTGGDTVYIRGGTYTEQVQFSSSSGGSASAGYLTIKSYANENVKFNLTTLQDWAWSFYDASSWVQYIKVDGSGNDGRRHFEVDGNKKARDCIRLQHTDHIVLQNIVVHGAINDSGGYGIRLWSIQPDSTGGGINDHSGARYCTISGCDVYDNDDYAVKVSGWEVFGNIVRNCQIHNNGTNGLSKYGINVSGSGYGGTVGTNFFFDCNFYSNRSTGLQFTETVGNLASNCNFYSNGKNGEGNGFSFGTSASGNVVAYSASWSNNQQGCLFYQAANNTIHHCLLYNNGANCIELVSGAAGNRILNCTLYGSYTPILLQASTRNTGITNCLVYVTGSNPVMDNSSGATLSGSDNNCWYQPSGGSDPAMFYWNNAKRTLSQFRSLTSTDNRSIKVNPALVSPGSDFRLQSGSPCLGSGVGIGYLFGGTTPDIGAYSTVNATLIQPPTALRVIATSTQ